MEDEELRGLRIEINMLMIAHYTKIRLVSHVLRREGI